MNDICPTSGTQLKVIPAGVSKATGKPYDSFVVCEVKGCKGPHIPGATYNPTAFKKPAPQATQSVTEPRNYRKEGYVRCLWNFWLAHSKVNEQYAELSVTDRDNVWRIFQQIEQDANGRFGGVDASKIPF